MIDTKFKICVFGRGQGREKASLYSLAQIYMEKSTSAALTPCIASTLWYPVRHQCILIAREKECVG